MKGEYDKLIEYDGYSSAYRPADRALIEGYGTNIYDERKT